MICISRRSACISSFGRADDISTFEIDFAARRLDQTKQAATDRGFSAARFADEPERFARLDIERNVIDRPHDVVDCSRRRKCLTRSPDRKEVVAGFRSSCSADLDRLAVVQNAPRTSAARRRGISGISPCVHFSIRNSQRGAKWQPSRKLCRTRHGTLDRLQAARPLRCRPR